MKGIVHIRAFKRGRLIWEIEKENAITSACLTQISKLIGGTTSNNFIGAVGFGSGTTAPASPPTSETDLTGTPAYYKALSTPTYSTPGQALFTWTLNGGTDTGAVGLNVQEIGFFANTGAISLPASRGSGGAAPNMTMCARILEAVGVVSSGSTLQGTWTFIG